MVLTSQAQAQAQAFQAAVGASAAGSAGNSRNPAAQMWNLQGGAFQPPMLGGIPPNYFPHFQTAAAQQQEANMAQVATVKLGNASKAPNKSNSIFVVRSSVRKFDSNGNITTVGMWARKVVEDNLEWLVKLVRRHGNTDNAVVLAYGDGCETLVLLDDHINRLPKDFSTLKKIGVGVSVAEADSKADQATLAASGVLQAGDSIWEHLHYQQVDANKTKKEKYLFIHTSHTIWSNAMDGRRKVVQVKSKGSSNPFMAVCYAPNATFEQKAVSSWAVATGGNPSGPTMVTNTTTIATATTASAAKVAVVGASDPVPPAGPTETLISFKPKQLLLLEKAFDNGLTPRDLKTDVKKINAEDKKKCQNVIRRARDEIITTTKKRRKKNPPAAAAVAVAKKPAPIKEVEKKEEENSKKEEPKKKVSSPKKKVVKKAEVKKGSSSSEQEDSDDEPISAMKPTKTKRAKSKSPNKSLQKTETASRKRGRPSTAMTKKETKKETKRTRSKSRSKK